MRGWLAEDGAFYDIGPESPATGLVRIGLWLNPAAPDSVKDALQQWVFIQGRPHRPARAWTQRKHYTRAQRDFLKQVPCVFEQTERRTHDP